MKMDDPVCKFVFISEILPVGGATLLCDAAGAAKLFFLSHSPAAILPHEAGAE